MKYILTSLLMLALLATTACAKSEDEGQVAQDTEVADVVAEVNAEPDTPPASEAAPPRNDRAQNRRERESRFWDSIGLTEAQRNEIRAIRTRGGSEDEIRAVLTDEQIQAVEEARANSRPQRPSPEDMQQLSERMNLSKMSEEQKAAIRARSAEKITVINPGTPEGETEGEAEEESAGEG